MSALGIKPIVERFLYPNYRFVLIGHEGYLFGRVLRRRVLQYKPWPLIDANGAAVDIAASSHQAELRFRDPRNIANTILYLDISKQAGSPWFLHGAFGIKPQYINMYLRQPEGQTIPGKFPNIDPTRPTGGDNFGYINSLSSPYEQPTDFVEVVLRPGVHITAEYYNKDSSQAHQPVLNILFCLYWVQFFDPTIQARQIADIALGREKAAYLTFGFGDIPDDIGDKVIEEWKVTPMTLERAATLGGGR